MLTTNRASAQIVTFSTTSLTAPQSQAATYNATQQASGVSGTPQLSRTTLTAGSGASGSFFSVNANTTNTLNLATNYVGFSVTPTAGSVLFATAINWNSQGSATAPNTYATAYSTDGFTTSTQTTFTGTNVITPQARNFNITDLITSDTLTVRLYNYGASAIGGGASSSAGSFRVINPTVTGSTLSATGGAIALTADTEIRNASDLTLGGVISNAFAVTKRGTGTLTLTDANTYTGGTTIATGTLQLGSGGTTGSVTGNILNNATLAFKRSNAVTVGNTISGTGATTFTGGGTYALTANNTYSGGTTITGATVLANNATASLGSGTITVGTGGVLGGIGVVGGTVSLQSGGTVSPGTSPGTLTASGFTWDGGGVLDFEMGATQALSDTLVLGSGAFTKGTAGTYRFNFTNMGAVVGTTYNLISFGSSVGWASDASDFTTTGLSGTFRFVGSTLTFTAAPEPSPLVLLGLGLISLGLARPRQRP